MAYRKIIKRVLWLMAVPAVGYAGGLFVHSLRGAPGRGTLTAIETALLTAIFAGMLLWKDPDSVDQLFSRRKQ